MNSKKVYDTLISLKLTDTYDITVSTSSKSMIYKKYEIKIVPSKHGYEEMFGYNFFLRGLKIDAAKDEYGNFKDMFDKTNTIDLTPRSLYELSPDTKKVIANIYNDPPRLSNLGYFALKTDDELEKLAPIILKGIVKTIDELD